MPHYKIAHLREQGQDMIIIPLDHSFENKTDDEQQGIITELQLHARGAGLAGIVVPVWEIGGRMKFIAPRSWHPFFRGLSLQRVFASVNKELAW
jgi:hypothetical protein